MSNDDRVVNSVQRGPRGWTGSGCSGGDLSSQGRGHEELEQDPHDDCKDRFGAHRRTRCAGNDVSVHGRWNGTRRVPAAVCVGRWQAVTEPHALSSLSPTSRPPESLAQCEFVCGSNYFVLQKTDEPSRFIANLCRFNRPEEWRSGVSEDSDPWMPR